MANSNKIGRPNTNFKKKIPNRQTSDIQFQNVQLNNYQFSNHLNESDVISEYEGIPITKFHTNNGMNSAYHQSSDGHNTFVDRSLNMTNGL